jgi:pyruvate formate lyase activating enzyme
MNIGGYLPFSLSDYPGHPSAVIFTQGCNFRCPFCHNGALIEFKEGSLTAAEVLNAAVKRRKLVHGVVVSGGEPCLQNDLAHFCASIKNEGFLVKLDTNGSLPDVLRHLLLSGNIDFVAMDVKASPRLYPVLCGVDVKWSTIAESINILTASGIPHHFRTTNVTPLLSAEEIARIAGHLPAGSKHSIQAFLPELARDLNLRSSSMQGGVCPLVEQQQEEAVTYVN